MNPIMQVRIVRQEEKMGADLDFMDIAKGVQQMISLEES